MHHIGRPVALIVFYVVVIALTLRLLYVLIVVEKNGPVLLAFSSSHGIHEGDLPALAIGVPLILLMLAGIALEARRLVHAVRARHADHG